LRVFTEGETPAEDKKEGILKTARLGHMPNRKVLSALGEDKRENGKLGGRVPMGPETRAEKRA